MSSPAKTPAAASARERANQACQPGRKVLVIEDSGVQAKIISKQIETLSHFSTCVAHSMQEAEALLKTHADIIVAVVDLNLPDAPDGEAVDLVLRYDVPAVVLTATYNDEIRRQFIEKRVADFFFKGSVRDMDPMVNSLERITKNRSIKVLLVDDSKTERGYMRAILEVQRFQVLEAGDGVAALRVLNEHPDIRLIITDYNMPLMDGFELIKAVRERHKKDRLAIIGVSAVGSGALSALFLKNGANDFLTKPFEVEEFAWRANQTVEMIEIIEELKICYESEGAGKG